MSRVSELSLFTWLLTQALLPDARRHSRLGVVLQRLGFNTARETRDFLCFVRINHAAPLHLDVTRAVATNPILRHRLRGIQIDEFLLELLGFEQLRPLLGRTFFQRYRFHLSQQEALWWAAEHFDRALMKKTMQPRPIRSPEQLLLAGAQAGRLC